MGIFQPFSEQVLIRADQLSSVKVVQCRLLSSAQWKFWGLWFGGCCGQKCECIWTAVAFKVKVSLSRNPWAWWLKPGNTKVRYPGGVSCYPSWCPGILLPLLQGYPVTPPREVSCYPSHPVHPPPHQTSRWSVAGHYTSWWIALMVLGGTPSRGVDKSL